MSNKKGEQPYLGIIINYEKDKKLDRLTKELDKQYDRIEKHVNKMGYDK